MKIVATLATAALLTSTAFSHFQTIIPESNHATSDKKRMSITYSFMHPFEQSNMQMDKPLKAGVVHGGKSSDLLPTLVESKKEKLSTWSTTYSFVKPGDYTFFVVPKPYFEPAEEKFIQHLTKTTVNGFGMEEGWSAPLGLEVEIVPLTRPYGLWKGNLFTGVVLQDGKPVPGAEVEVEYLNNGSKIKAPHETMITQVVKCDSNGVFSYAMPHAGWWGFAALMEGKEKLKHTDGKAYPVELGAVIWVKSE